jgi:hypothetical protein
VPLLPARPGGEFKDTTDVEDDRTNRHVPMLTHPAEEHLQVFIARPSAWSADAAAETAKMYVN